MARSKLALTDRQFGVMRVLAKRQDPYADAHGKGPKSRMAAILEQLRARRLITHTNVVAEPWKLTTMGEELLKLRDLGEQRLEERRRSSWRHAGAGR